MEIAWRPPLLALRSRFEVYFQHALASTPFEGSVEEAVRCACEGGKRLRPTLMLALADAAKHSDEAILPAAVCVEMIHTASLIVDDLPTFDDASERRGRPALHIAFGADLALLASFELLSTAYSELVTSCCLARFNADETAEAVRSVSRTIGLHGMTGGMELETRRQVCTEPAYRDMISMKTSSLFCLGAKIAAAIARPHEASSEAMVALAHDVGLAYQLADDVRDAEEDGERTSKRPAPLLTPAEARVWIGRHLDSALALARTFPGKGSALEMFVLALRANL